jgi:hypothetical protein
VAVNADETYDVRLGAADHVDNLQRRVAAKHLKRAHAQLGPTRVPHFATLEELRATARGAVAAAFPGGVDWEARGRMHLYEREGKRPVATSRSDCGGWLVLPCLLRGTRCIVVPLGPGDFVRFLGTKWRAGRVVPLYHSTSQHHEARDPGCSAHVCGC